MGKKSVAMIRGNRMPTVLVFLHTGVGFFRQLFWQCSKHLLAPTVYQEQVYSYWYSKAQVQYLFQNLSTWGTKEWASALGDLGKLSVIEKGLKHGSDWHLLMEDVGCRCIIIPTTDSALCSFLEEPRTLRSHWTVSEAPVSTPSVYRSDEALRKHGVGCYC